MTTPERVGVLVVDDHQLFVRGLEVMLPGMSDGRVTVVAWTDDASAAAALARQLVPDLVLVDLIMPEPGGLRAIAAVRRAEPRSRIVALSGTDDEDLATAALEAGADGFLPKAAGPDSLVPALLAVVDGWAVVPAALLRRLTDLTREPAQVRDLGGAERHLWRRLAEGRSTAQIATELHVSERTAKRLTAALLRRLGVSSRIEAAALAGAAGLLPGNRPGPSRHGPPAVGVQRPA